MGQQFFAGVESCFKNHHSLSSSSSLPSNFSSLENPLSIMACLFHIQSILRK